MIKKYIINKKIQDVLKKAYYSHKMNIYDVYNYFLEESSPRLYNINKNSIILLDDNQFEDILLNAPTNILNPNIFCKNNDVLEENSLFDYQINNNIDVFRYLNYYQDIIHSHSFIEMFYILKGQCTIVFQNKEVILKEGDYIIIAPQTIHSVISDDDNFILTLSIKKSNFEALYHQIISKQNILAIFLRNIVCMKNTTGYLLFHTEKSEDIKYIIKSMTLEVLKNDEYNDLLSNYWLTILLTHLIRDYYSTMETMPEIYINQFSYIIQYIIENYRTVTLDELVNHFGYTKPYLCELIKNYTGHTFTYLVNLEKTNNATILLKENQYSIEYISHHLGYNSSTHFSRTFKKYYGISPIEYRLQNKKE